MMFRDEIKQAIEEAAGELGLTSPEFSLEHPANELHGDWTTNIAMALLAKEKLKRPACAGRQNSREVAEKIVEKLAGRLTMVEKVEAAGAGFINFYLKREWLVEQMARLLEDERLGVPQVLQGKRVVVEYTDPNPFKEFHIGHLYSNTVGESLCRLLEALGAKVWRADYFGDVGMHVAKALWGLLAKFKTPACEGRQNSKLKKIDLGLKELEEKPLAERVKFLGEGYALGATAYEENETAKEDMKALNFLLFKAAQEVVLPEFKEKPQVDYDRFIKESKYDYAAVKRLYETGRRWSLEYFETIYQRVGTKFAGYYPESRTGEFGYGMVIAGLKKGVFEKGERGAIVFAGEKYGLHTRVFINALGLPTYETKDLGNAAVKAKDFAYDLSLIVTGKEIDEYFRVVIKAMTQVKPELGEKTVHLGHGMVRLKEGKMSSRTGRIVRGEELLDEVKTRIQAIMQKGDSLQGVSLLEAAEKVAVGAVKYAFLKQGIGEDIVFDFDKSLALEGNSGPYLMYTYARCRSVLTKVKEIEKGYTLQGVTLNDEELSILRYLYRFGEVVEAAGRAYAPQLLAGYLYELAGRFNRFYNKHSILGRTKSEIAKLKSQNSKPHGKTKNYHDGEGVGARRQFRLALTAAVARMLKKGLGLLGVETVERM